MAQGIPAPAARPFDPEAGRDRLFSRPGYFWFGTAEELAARIRGAVAGLPVDTVFLWGSIGGMGEKLVERTVGTICRRLAPLLRAPDA